MFSGSMLAVTSIIKRWFGVQASRNLFGGACLTQKDICAVLLILCGEVMTDKPKPMTLRERFKALCQHHAEVWYGGMSKFDDSEAAILREALDQLDKMASLLHRAVRWTQVDSSGLVFEIEAALARHEGRDE